VPEAQKKVAGQGTQVSWRMRFVVMSATNRTPDGEEVIPKGLLNTAATPIPLA
jgi:hypothetical protein